MFNLTKILLIVLTLFFGTQTYISTALAQSLEARFASQIHTNLNENTLDITNVSNEDTPQTVKPHLDLVRDPGAIIAVGSVRGLFDLLLCETCNGLVAINRNSDVKKYMDFEILLLRISQNARQYSHLAAIAVDRPNFPALESEIRALIAAKLPMFPSVQEYYQNNLLQLADVYYRFGTPGLWSISMVKNWKTPGNPAFHGVRYYENETQFQRLHKFAEEGNIIALTGDIQHLKRFDKEGETDTLAKVASVIDISNISNVSPLVPLALDLPPDVHPRIIWVNPRSTGSSYFSYVFQHLSDEQRREYDAKLAELQQPRATFTVNDGRVPAKTVTSPITLRTLSAYIVNPKPDIFNTAPSNSYTEQVLAKMNMLTINPSTQPVPRVSTAPAAPSGAPSRPSVCEQRGVPTWPSATMTLREQNAYLQTLLATFAYTTSHKSDAVFQYLAERIERSGEYDDSGVKLSTIYQALLTLIVCHPVALNQTQHADNSTERMIQSSPYLDDPQKAALLQGELHKVLQTDYH